MRPHPLHLHPQLVAHGGGHGDRPVGGVEVGEAGRRPRVVAGPVADDEEGANSCARSDRISVQPEHSSIGAGWCRGLLNDFVSLG